MTPKCLIVFPKACLSGRDRESEEENKYSGYAGRSNLFGSDPYLEDVKKRMKKEYHEDDRFEADQSVRKVKDRAGEKRQPEYRAEMIYSSDLVSVLEMFAKQREIDGDLIFDNCGFYHACLDRIDILLTEKHSQVQKSHILSILRELAYFRPKKVHRGSKVSEAYGDYSHN